MRFLKKVFNFFIYLLTLMPLLSLFYITKQISLSFKVLQLLASFCLFITHTHYFLLVFKLRPRQCSVWVFVICRLLYPFLLMVGLVWVKEILQYSLTLFKYYNVGVIYGMAIYCSIPCECLIYFDQLKLKYKNATYFLLASFLCCCCCKWGRRRFYKPKIHVQRVVEMVNVSQRNRNQGEDQERHDQTFEDQQPQETHQRLAVIARAKFKFSSNEVILHKKKPSSLETNSSEEKCAICLDQFKPAMTVALLPQCKHTFHRVCLRDWVRKDGGTCPICRAPVRAPSFWYKEEQRQNQ